MKGIQGVVIVVVVVVLLCLAVVLCAVGAYVLLAPGEAGAGALIPPNRPPVAGPPTSAGETGNPLGPQILGASPVIYLAGRTDIPIPPLDQASDVTLFACRPGPLQEIYPPGYRIVGGAEITFSAEGKINFYGGPPEDGFLPDGDSFGSLAYIDSFGGLSGFIGPAGGLTAVFIDDSIPNGTPPDPIDFTPDGIGIDFERLEPGLGQVFFVGDGVNSRGQSQVFVAPANATRLYVGLADASFFYGPPGCYSDNTGEYNYEVQSNLPIQPLP